MTAATSFAPGSFQPLWNPVHTLPPMDVFRPEVGGGKSGKTLDRAMQSSPMDGTHECITRPFEGQHFFCAIEGLELDVSRAKTERLSLYFG